MNKIYEAAAIEELALTLVQLFERERLRLRYKEQDEDESHDIPCGVPSEGTLRFERS